VNAEPLRALIELRLHCRDCRAVQFACPHCAEPFTLALAPGAPFPLMVPPRPCPDCGALLHARVLGYHPNPTNERPAPEALSDSLAALERAYASSPATPPPPVPVELAQAWSLILSRLELPSTRMLLSQQGRLIELSQTRAVVAVRAHWAPMVQTRAELLRDAIQRVSGHRPALELLPVAELPASPVVATIRPPAPRWAAPAAAATTPPRRRPPARRSRRPRPARPAPRRRAPAAPPPTYRQPCPSTAARRTLAAWAALGLPLATTPGATIARGFREVFGCEPQRHRQTRAYSRRELAAVLQQLGHPIPAALQGLEVVK
jgi:hypothetical protein